MSASTTGATMITMSIGVIVIVIPIVFMVSMIILITVIASVSVTILITVTASVCMITLISLV